jgi:hypothetical protein
MSHNETHIIGGGFHLRINDSQSSCSCSYDTFNIEYELHDHNVDNEIIADLVCVDCGDECVLRYRQFLEWDNLQTPDQIAVTGELTIEPYHEAESLTVSEWEEKGE